MHNVLPKAFIFNKMSRDFTWVELCNLFKIEGIYKSHCYHYDKSRCYYFKRSGSGSSALQCCTYLLFHYLIEFKRSSWPMICHSNKIHVLPIVNIDFGCRFINFNPLASSRCSSSCTLPPLKNVLWTFKSVWSVMSFYYHDLSVLVWVKTCIRWHKFSSLPSEQYDPSTKQPQGLSPL